MKSRGAKAEGGGRPAPARPREPAAVWASRLAILGAAGLAAAAAGAIAAHVLAGLFYLAFVVPAAWGAGLGIALAWGIRWARWPDRRAAMAAGILVPLLSYGIFHSLQNGRLRARAIEQLGSEQEYEEVLRERKGGTGFWAELSLRSDTGMNVSRPGRRGRAAEAPPVSGAGMYAYWLVELSLLGAACVFFPLRAARRPFCGKCREWYVPAGTACVADRRAETALRALERKDFAVFTGCLTPNGSPHIARMEICPRCHGSPVRFLFESTLQDGRGRSRRRVLYDQLISRESLHSLRALGLVLRDSRGTRAGR